MSKPTEAPRIVVKKRKAGHAGHHGGAWKVAYADFVTAMMALFMVLWLLTQADVKLRSQIAQYFRDPGVLPGGQILSSEVNAALSRDPAVVEKDILVVAGKSVDKKQKRPDPNLKKLQQQQQQPSPAQVEQKALEQQAQAIEQAIAKVAAGDPKLAGLRDQVIITVTDAGLLIQVIDKAYNKQLLFDISSAELKPPLVELLRRVAAILATLPNHIQVGGHTDSRPYPAESTRTNWELSFERANNARHVLETNGLRPGQISRVLAYADSEPLVPENPLADENRRLTILAQRMAAAEDSASADDAPGAQHGPTVLPPDQLPERTAKADPAD
jgi:chemotaxis protein MotB